MTYKRFEYGFKQIDPKPFTYDREYRMSQATTKEMAYLRIGALQAGLSSDPIFGAGQQIKDMTLLEFGSGSGVFATVAKQHFKSVDSYDVDGSGISEASLMLEHYDIMTAFDVIEHMPEPKDIFKIGWEYLYLSTPVAPYLTEEEANNGCYKHAKPDEHLWLFNGLFPSWLYLASETKCKVLSCNYVEDVIRGKLQCKGKEEHNIMSVLLHRPLY